MKSVWFCLFLFSFNFILSIGLLAQEVTGRIEGRIVDSTGSAIPGVIITASSPHLQGTRTTQTNENGLFRLILLPPGFYSVNINHIAYRPITIDSIQVRLGKTTYIGELILTEEPFEMEEVVVKDRKTLIDPTSTVTGGNFTKDEIESLPLQRNYQDISLLVPQINKSYLGDENNYSGATGPETKYYIDGIDVTDPVMSNRGIEIPYNFIREIEIKTGGYEAEYRSSLGGVLNVLTPSGGDEIKGQVFGFFTNNVFMGEPKKATDVEASSGDFTYYDFGFSLGGPFIKERLWFNAAYNPKVNIEEVIIPGIGYEPDKKITHLFAGKLSWNISNQSKLIINVNGDPSSRDLVQFDAGLSGINEYATADAARYNWIDGGCSGSIQGLFNVNKNLFLEASFSALLRNFILQPRSSKSKPPMIIDYETGIVSGGVAQDFETYGIKYNPSIKLSWLLEDHLIKVGMEFIDNKLNDESYSLAYYKYSDSLYFKNESFSSGSVGNRVVSVFAHDSWRINDRLQMNAGLRWDGQYIINSEGGVSQTILNQFQPRIGLIYTPDRKKQQKVFGSYGRFYHDLTMFVLKYYYLKNSVLLLTQFDHDPRLDPTGADTLLFIKGQFQQETEGMNGQYYDEFSLGYESILFHNYKFSIRGTYRTMGNGIEDGYSDEWGKFAFGNPGYYPLTEYPKVQREYSALEVSFQKVSDDPFNFLCSYVLSKNYGNYSGFFAPEFQTGGVPNFTVYFDFPETMINGTGLLLNDRTHSFKFFGSYRFSFGFSVGLSFFLASGTPLNELGASIYGPYELNFLKQRGTAGRTPTIWDLSLRLGYTLPSIYSLDYSARIIVDIFHIASQRTPVNYDQIRYLSIDEEGNQADPNPTYGRAFEFLPPMLMRIGLEIDF